MTNPSCRCRPNEGPNMQWSGGDQRFDGSKAGDVHPRHVLLMSCFLHNAVATSRSSYPDVDPGTAGWGRQAGDVHPGRLRLRICPSSSRSRPLAWGAGVSALLARQSTLGMYTPAGCGSYVGCRYAGSRCMHARQSRDQKGTHAQMLKLGKRSDFYN